jgi:hypothetical protein
MDFHAALMQLIVQGHLNTEYFAGFVPIIENIQKFCMAGMIFAERFLSLEAPFHNNLYTVVYFQFNTVQCTYKFIHYVAGTEHIVNLDKKKPLIFLEEGLLSILVL